MSDLEEFEDFVPAARAVVEVWAQAEPALREMTEAMLPGLTRELLRLVDAPASLDNVVYVCGQFGYSCMAAEHLPAVAGLRVSWPALVDALIGLYVVACTDEAEGDV